jgi:hypothetical protein
MNLHKALFVSLALLVPTSAFAAINDDGGGEGGGGGDPDDAPTVYEKSYNKHDYWGLTGWGAGYEITGRIYAMPAVGTYKDRLGARVSGDTYARLNGSRYGLFKAVAVGNTEAKRKTEASVNAYIGTANVFTKSWTSTSSTKTLWSDTKSWTQPFFDKTVPVDVLGIPVSFRARGLGALMLTAGVELSNVGIEASAKPQGYASLYVSAAVGGTYCFSPGLCVGASAGVYSDVKLLSLQAPAKAETWWALSPAVGVSVSYQAKADLTVSTLDGEAGVFADACLVGCVHKSLKLIDWNGFSKTYPIANFSGSWCLAGTCTATNAQD